MTFTVVWRPSAQQLLAQIWLSGPDRNAITAASAAIDFALKRDPLNVGESRGGVERLALFRPLWVHFSVSEPDRTVGGINATGQVIDSIPTPRRPRDLRARGRDHPR
jgi:hypothetical protein